eukprot:COSAG06_NODE_34345_length_476_cov_0.668435_1_plen_77_part_10
MVENVVPVQLMHSVLASLGPVPAPHAEHVVRSALTTFGESQLIQSAPNAEYVVPVHGTHAVRSAFGSSPGEHTEHV